MKPQTHSTEFELRKRSKDKPIFLSSLSTNLGGLRATLAVEFEPNLWVAEIDDPTLINFDELLRVDACVRSVMQSRLLVCLLGGDTDARNNWGTTIVAEEINTVVSYFEIEVIHAILNRIPVIILAREDYRPAPRLAAFISVLKDVGVAVLWREGLKDGEIETAIRKVIHEEEKWRREGEDRRQMFAHSLANDIRKSHPLSRKLSEKLPATRWFAGHRIATSGERLGNQEKAKALIELARTSVGYDKILTRLYMAASELMLIQEPEEAVGQTLILWLDLLEIWGSSAAWIGMHNHLNLGVISTLASQAVLRERIEQTMPEYARTASVDGAFASAYYSFGKQCTEVTDQQAVLKAAEEFAGLAIRTRKDPGAYIVRASIRREMKRILPLFFDLAVLILFAIFSKNRGLRTESLMVVGNAIGRISPSIGVLILKRAAGIRKAEFDSGRIGPEFVVKTYKRLIEILLLTRKRAGARDFLNLALDLARQHAIEDQVMQLERLRAQLDKIEK